MRKRLIITFVSIIVFIFILGKYKGCELIDGIYKSRAVRVRVHAVLRGIQKKPHGIGTIGDEQLALAKWYADIAVISDPSALNHASDDFDNWRKGANFYIHDYSITNVEREKEYPSEDQEETKDKPKPWVFIVTGKIEGSTFIMRVPEGDTISWIQPPW